MKTFKEVPSWATAMVRNFRDNANLPESITDLQIFTVVENEDLCLIDSPEDQIDILRSLLV